MEQTKNGVPVFSKLHLAEQSRQGKTPADAFRHLIYLSAMAAVALAVTSGVTYCGGGVLRDTRSDERMHSSAEIFFTVVLMVLVLATLVSLVLTVVGAMKLLAPRRNVTCPRCHNVHRLWRSVTFYACPACALPLNLVAGAEDLRLSACTFCGFSSGVCGGVIPSRCRNCGVEPTTGLTSQCSQCGAQLAAGLFECPSCRRLVRGIDPILADATTEAQLSRDAYGLTLNVRAQLAGFVLSCRTIPAAQKGAAYFCDLLDNMGSIIGHLVRIWANASHLLESGAIRRTLKEIDQAYVTCLSGMHAYISSNSGTWYTEGVFSSLERSRHSKAKDRVIAAVQDLAARSRYELGDVPLHSWATPLLGKPAFQTKKATDGKLNYLFQDIRPILAEVARFNGTDAGAPVSPTSTSQPAGDSS